MRFKQYITEAKKTDYKIGEKMSVIIPKSYKYPKDLHGKSFEGKITKINKKTYEVNVKYTDGILSVLIKKDEL